MRDKPVQQDAKLDVLLWLVVVVMITSGVIANIYFSEVAWSLRLAGWILLACAAVLIAVQTVVGRAFWEFSLAARGELRKVVWPTRQETVQTTIMVVAMVIVAAMVLWGVDTILMWAIGLIMGQ